MHSRFSTNGKPISLLGFGAMRIPTKPGSSEFDAALFNEYVAELLAGGVTYFDTSPAYCRGESERLLGNALAASGAAREKYILATKLSNFAEAQFSLEKVKAMFASSLKNLRTSYIDNYLLHSLGGGDGMGLFRRRMLDNGAIDFCLEQRAAGIIRNLGFSFHGKRKVFDWCLEHHDKYKWDFVQIVINYVDWRRGEAKALYEALAAKKIPVVVMAPLQGGRLARYNWALANELVPRDPKASLAKWALRFAASRPQVMTVLSGMAKMEHIKENLETFTAFKPLSADEEAALFRAADIAARQATIPCNDCKYCMPCPYGLDIPAILSFRNRMKTMEKPLSARETLAAYEKAIPESLRRAEHCTGCGRCSPHCPQQLDIPSEIAAIDEWIEELKNEAL